MSKCNRLCSEYLSKDTCEYCRKNYVVSEEFYRAKRNTESDSYVFGYLVRNKENNKVEGILNVATEFHELAAIDPNTLDIYTEKQEEKSEFDKCKCGRHPFISVCKVNAGYDTSKVVRWCPECGCVVVDMDYDNRTNAGYYMKMRQPRILNNITLSEDSKEVEVIQKPNIKSFDFPSFDEWFNSFEYRGKLGVYYCHIRIFCYGNSSNTIKFAVSRDSNPINIYAERLFDKVFEYSGEEDKEKLRQWYNDTIEKFKEFWSDYIISTYIG